jgi:acylphosphatase
MDAGIHIVVKGYVQGVGFRYFVYNRASHYKLTGYVQNLYDGRVVIEAEGDRSLLEEFVADIKIGPRAARVSGVQVTWKAPQSQYSQFEIR